MGAPRPASPTVPGEDEAPVRRRVAWPRVGLLVLVVALVAGGGYLALDRTSDADATAATDAARTSPVVPYVDVTLTPTFQFQDPAVNPARTVALAFVVADPADACAPSWGGYYSLEQAATDLELDRRITRLRSGGGDVTVSFGGASNTELAVACTDVDALADAYGAVVDRYDLATVDVDVEGTAVADRAAALRRASALATVQRERAAAGTPLAVWLTLPVAPSGLSADAVDQIATSLAGGVDLAGVNVMTMDFGAAKPDDTSMLDASTQALEATAAQLVAVYRAAGTELSAEQAWGLVGATPMIGQNDVEGEVFTLDDAAGLATFAGEHALGRVSLWSLNRDAPCSASFAAVAVLSNTCSGVAQDPLAFVAAFAELADRTPIRVDETADDATARSTVVDDPATSPYPVWRAEGHYPGGYKVVWQGSVYQARWYTVGVDPAKPADGADFPWTLVGAVTSTDPAPAPVPTVTDVTEPWTPGVLYRRGDRVLLDGLPYEARWTSIDEVPGTAFPVSPDEAWAPLFTLPGEPAGS